MRALPGSAAPGPARGALASAAPWWKGALQVLLLGATLGSAMDALHTWGGVTRYTSPVWLATSWWVPPLFAGAYLLLALVYRLSRSAGPRPATGWASRLGAAAIFTALYASSAFVPAGNGVKLAILVGGAAVLFLALDRSRAALVTGVVAAVVGPLSEVVLVRLDLFAHLQPDLAGIPLWLPGLYLASGPGLGGLLGDRLDPPG